MANELIALDTAILDLLTAFTAVEQGLPNSDRGGQVLRALSHRVVQQLEDVLAHSGLKHEARMLGTTPGTAVGLKSTYGELSSF